MFLLATMMARRWASAAPFEVTPLQSALDTRTGRRGANLGIMIGRGFGYALRLWAYWAILPELFGGSRMSKYSHLDPPVSSV